MKSSRVLGCLLMFSLPAAGAQAQASGAARAIVARAIAVVGVHRDLHSMRSLQMSERTISFHITDSDHADAPFLVAFGNATVTDDLPGRRESSTSVSVLPGNDTNTPGKESRITGTLILTRDIAQYAVSRDNDPPSTNALAVPPTWETSNPVQALLIAAAAPDLTQEPDAISHDAPQHVVSFTNDGYRVRLFINADTDLPSAVEATVDYRGEIAWNAWGDVVERTEYQNWTLVDGIRYPFQWDITRNGDIYKTIALSQVHADVPLAADAFAIAATTRKDADTPGIAAADDIPLGTPGRPISEIAPGIVQIPGSWYTTLVRQNDGIVIIDAPISAGYSQRVIAEVQRRFPGVPIKALITSTGYFWHIAGVREYAARGIPIYVLDHNAPTVHRLLSAPHTIVPDDLAKSGRQPDIRIVSDRTVIGSGHNQLVVLPIRRASGNMLMTYIPDAKLAHTAEMAQPLGPNGSFLFPESLLELKEAIRDAHITVSTIIGMHMSPTPWSKVEDTLRAASPQP